MVTIRYERVKTVNESLSMPYERVTTVNDSPPISYERVTTDNDSPPMPYERVLTDNEAGSMPFAAHSKVSAPAKTQSECKPIVFHPVNLRISPPSILNQL